MQAYRNIINFYIQQPCWTLIHSNSLLILLDFLCSKLYHVRIKSATSLILVTLISRYYCIALASISTQYWIEMVLIGILVSFLLVFSSLSKTTINPKAVSLTLKVSFRWPLNNYIQIKVLRSYISQKKKSCYYVPWRIWYNILT